MSVFLFPVKKCILKKAVPEKMTEREKSISLKKNSGNKPKIME